MPQSTRKRSSHPDLRLVHSIPGRIRLKAKNLYRQSRSAEEIVRKLSIIDGLHSVEANPTTGSLTMRYHHSALASVTFFTEVSAALGLIAEGIDPGTVDTLFHLMGTSPEDLAKSLDAQHLVLPIATFAVGLYLGRQMF